ncbi:MAG: hypothetical protein AAFR44_10810, partial [Pseudomonadota bacterium]
LPDLPDGAHHRLDLAVIGGSEHFSRDRAQSQHRMKPSWFLGRSSARAAGPVERAGAEVLGPALAPISKVRGRTRMRLLVRAPKGVALQDAIRDWLAGVKVPAAVRVSVDIDPQSFL